MFLIASGKVDFQQLIEQVSLATAAWPQRATTRPAIAPIYHSGLECIQRDATHQHYAIQAWPGVDCNAPERYALRLLCSILADDSGSRLFWELIDTGLAETAALWPQMFDDCGCVFGYLCCAPDDVQENEAVFSRVIQEAIREGVTEKEIELARSKIASSLILSDERPSNRLFALGQSWLNRGSYEPLDVVLARYHAVTAEEIQRVAARTLGAEPATIKVIGPQGN
jgi:predicted Zn-dependent peptidase